MSSKLGRVLAAAVLAAPLGGCASTGHFLAHLIGYKPAAKMAEAKPVYLGAADLPIETPTDRLYAAAAAKIEARDYGAALDLLQFAREASPGDARVLNAMGVIYDKLGRFDLSDRYYGLALAAEPGSRVVAANVRYSEILRAAAEAPRSAALIGPPELQLAQAEQERPPAPSQGPLRATSGLRQIAAAGQPLRVGLRIAAATGTVRRSEPLMAGYSLALINATGRDNAAQPARLYLAREGWSLASADAAAPAQARSEIRFAPRNQAVAEVLARTLPFKVALTACARDCAFQLVLGRDAPASLTAAGRVG